MSAVIDLSNARSEQREQRVFDTLAENYPDGTMLVVKAYPNLDTTDEEEIPSGMIAIHPVNAQVNTDSLRENMFNYLVVSKVAIPEGVSAETLSAQANELNEACPQYNRVAKGPSLKMRLRDQNADRRAWGAELGEEDSFVGLYTSTRADGRTKDHYLVAKAGAPKACRQLKDMLVSKPITFGELVNNPDVSYVRSLAERNACRLLYNAARALRVRINAQPDYPSFLPEGEEDEHVAKPFRAIPDFSQSMFTIKSEVYDGKQVVSIYNSVCPSSECNKAGNSSFFVVASPYEGVYLYPMANGTAGLGLPVDTGRRKEWKSDTAQVGKRAADGIIWEGSNRSYHKDLEPHAFNPVDQHFESVMEQSGWNRSDRRSHLVPIVLKMSNSELSRK